MIWKWRKKHHCYKCAALVCDHVHCAAEENMDFTKHADVLHLILAQWNASVDSFAALLRLRSTCTTAKQSVDTMLQPGQDKVPHWLPLLYARTRDITNREVLLNLRGGPGMEETPQIHESLRYITRAEVFRNLQPSYFFDEKAVGIILYHLNTQLDMVILAIEHSITHQFHAAIRLLGDVCIRAMRCHLKNRDILLHGCAIMANAESHASKDCLLIGQQLPMLTDALCHHQNDLRTVSALLRFIYRMNRGHQFFKYTRICDCGVAKCDKFSAALASVMQCHMHSDAWRNVQAGVALNYSRTACVNIACDLLAHVWNMQQDEYFTSVGFADSVKALVDALRFHKGRSPLKRASNAVSVLLRRVSVGRPEIQTCVKILLQASGWIKPTRRVKN